MENKDIRILREDIRKTNLGFYGRGIKERKFRALKHLQFFAALNTHDQPEKGILFNGVYYSEEILTKMIDEEIRE